MFANKQEELKAGLILNYKKDGIVKFNFKSMSSDELEKQQEEMMARLSPEERKIREEGTNKLMLDLQNKKGPSAPPLSGQLIGQNAPEFTAPDLQGTTYTLSKLRGKVVVLNFWFAGCSPCRQEMPELNELVKKYGNQNIQFIGFTMDQTDMAKKFLSKTKFDYHTIPNSSKIANAYKVEAFPTNVVIDKTGKIVYGVTGYDPTDKSTMQKLDQAISEALAK